MVTKVQMDMRSFAGEANIWRQERPIFGDFFPVTQMMQSIISSFQLWHSLSSCTSISSSSFNGQASWGKSQLSWACSHEGVCRSKRSRSNRLACSANQPFCVGWTFWQNKLGFPLGALTVPWPSWWDGCSERIPAPAAFSWASHLSSSCCTKP